MAVKRSTPAVFLYKLFQTAVKCCSQGGVRGGCSDLVLPDLAFEVENLLVLKTTAAWKTTVFATWIMAYKINKNHLSRLIKNQNVTLFSPSDVPGLYDAFLLIKPVWAFVWAIWARWTHSQTQCASGKSCLALMMQERASTGRILCKTLTIATPTVRLTQSVAPIPPIQPVYGNRYRPNRLTTSMMKAEIALCTLSGINLGEINQLEDIKELANHRALLMPCLTTKTTRLSLLKMVSMKRRTLGIGVINYAYYLAKMVPNIQILKRSA